MSEIAAVVYDIGNVLIEWHPERLYDQIIPDIKARERLFKEVDLHAMNDCIDRGAPFRETIYAKAEEFPQYRDLIRLWHDRWIDMASPVIQGSLILLRRLRKNGVPVLALSNFGIESFEYAESKYPFLSEFDQRFISGHMGVIKPESQIYKMLEDSCGYTAQSLLFTDDRAENIAAAAARGWNTHLFTAPQEWAKTLVSHGLLTPREAELEV